MKRQSYLVNKTKIQYKNGYKYQLVHDFNVVVDLGVKPFEMDFVLYRAGLLSIKKGYAWNGASGPALDTKSFMRGSLVHDALYQAMGNGLLDVSKREFVDGFLISICKFDGMPLWRRLYVKFAVRGFGGLYLGKDTILTAP